MYIYQITVFQLDYKVMRWESSVVLILEFKKASACNCSSLSP